MGEMSNCKNLLLLRIFGHSLIKIDFTLQQILDYCSMPPFFIAKKYFFFAKFCAIKMTPHKKVINFENIIKNVQFKLKFER